MARQRGEETRARCCNHANAALAGLVRPGALDPLGQWDLRGGAASSAAAAPKREGTASPKAAASWRSWIRDMRVNDNGRFIEVDFDLCTPQRTDYEFVLEVTRLADGDMTAYHSNGKWDGTQPRACGAYTLGKRDRLIPGEHYKARLRAYLFPGGKIKSRAVKFNTDG